MWHLGFCPCGSVAHSQLSLRKITAASGDRTDRSGSFPCLVFCMTGSALPAKTVLRLSSGQACPDQAREPVGTACGQCTFARALLVFAAVLPVFFDCLAGSPLRRHYGFHHDLHTLFVFGLCCK